LVILLPALAGKLSNVERTEVRPLRATLARGPGTICRVDGGGTPSAKKSSKIWTASEQVFFSNVLPALSNNRFPGSALGRIHVRSC